MKYANLVYGMNSFAAARYLRNHLDITMKEAWEIIKQIYPWYAL